MTLKWLTQGSQSLALGLTLTAAPHLVEGSRLKHHDSMGGLFGQSLTVALLSRFARSLRPRTPRITIPAQKTFPLGSRSESQTNDQGFQSHAVA
jgi:hypothetical protein